MNFLLVSDMQNDFVTGPLGTPEAQSIVPAIAKTIHNFPGEVGFAVDLHLAKTYASLQEGKKFPVLHCHSYPGSKIITELKPMALAVYPKSAPGCQLYAEHIWKRYYETNGNLTITLAGVRTDISIISTALLLRTSFPDVAITVDASCCAGTTPENHKKALDIMKQCYIDVTINGQ
jgi:nicotinamidase/pyrazinamidase